MRVWQSINDLYFLYIMAAMFVIEMTVVLFNYIVNTCASHQKMINGVFVLNLTLWQTETHCKIISSCCRTIAA